jgi:hypothetical protein
MHINKANSSWPALLTIALVFCICTFVPARAQEPPAELQLGKIKGTDMLRDEFRARGRAKLAAIALNALTYYEVEGEYPADFYELRRCAAWNLEVTNLFTGRPIQAVFFEPKEEDLTSAPPLDVISIGIPSTPAPIGSATDEAGTFDPAKMGELLANQPPKNVSRVDPRQIKDPEPGEVFYYTSNGLLQLVMFAPDGTFVELVDETPNRSWLARFRTNSMLATWPTDLYAAQVLFYLEQLLPQYYNLAMFMGDRETLPRPQFASMGGDELILLADELGITPLNPVSKDPLGLSMDVTTPGNLFEPDPAQRSPLHISLPDGRILTLTDLRSEAQPPDQAVTSPAGTDYKRRGEHPAKPKAPPMGGRK